MYRMHALGNAALLALTLGAVGCERQSAEEETQEAMEELREMEADVQRQREGNDLMPRSENPEEEDKLKLLTNEPE